MNRIIIIASLFICNLTFAESISGVVSVKGDAPKGILYIFAKKFDGKMPMPLAVKKIIAPKFPVKFELSQKDAMMKQIPFQGPFKITARISPSGSAMDKSGIEASTTGPIKLGQKDIQLKL